MNRLIILCLIAAMIMATIAMPVMDNAKDEAGTLFSFQCFHFKILRKIKNVYH
jgi:hypothetical protein